MKASIRVVGDTDPNALFVAEKLNAVELGRVSGDSAGSGSGAKRVSDPEGDAMRRIEEKLIKASLT